jgi:hypothetical protein
MKLFRNLLEILWYPVSISSVWWVLAEYGILDGHINFWLVVLAWVITYSLGDYLIETHERYLLKRRIMKVAKQVAEYEGIDPKSLDYKDLIITVDEEGYMEVEIQINKQGEKKDDTRI